MNQNPEIEGISQRIRSIRTDKKLTLEKLAGLVGCTKAFLSQVENGTANPSITMLYKIAGALEVHVSELFRAQAGNHIRTFKLAKAERRTIHYPDGKVESQLLTRGVFQKKMQPVISYVEPGGTLDEGDRIVHPPGSEEFVLVLKGKLEFNFVDETIIVVEGDTLYFDGSLPHSWANRGQEPAIVLFVWTPPIW
jgi:transcriptional regulator with XRE-family HTH domain